MFELDPIHEDMFSQEITQAVWREKYRYGSESHPFESFKRVCDGVYALDAEGKEEAFEAMKAGLWCPAGRIHAGAGTSKRVTSINCFVMRTIPDSLDGIGSVLQESMLTMQQGGGIGLDFSTLRPRGAPLVTTGEGAVASGPVSYMDMWNSMCATIMSAGSRRGAMMAVLDVSHPDIEEFIEAKHEEGRLTNFNVSVLVSDDFMQAVRRDGQFNLTFNDKVYRSVSARELWNKIIYNTYEYSEPGVVFIDRINEQNNLNYCETIRATNPCGEQPLPPGGACNLGAINLARMVHKPFTDDAEFDLEMLKKVAKTGVRFLDNVIDITHYPLQIQRKEEFAKRRIGLGITGLANAMMQMQIAYGSKRSVAFTRQVMETIRDAAYAESVTLAAQRGPFQLFDASYYLYRPFVQGLPESLQDAIRKHGIRNGVLLTIAPTGTTSLYYGNVSSGLEPPFLLSYKRWMLQADGSRKEYEVEDYGYKLYKKIASGKPNYMVTTEDLRVSNHLAIQSTCQEYVDASISKTINCPKEMSFEDFKEVYSEAYNLGCKGVTTYRPSDVRGAVLSPSEPQIDLSEVDFEDLDTAYPDVVPPRPADLSGRTYKIKWPHVPQAFYITINNIGKPPRPYEIFIASKSAKYMEWMTGLCLMITAIFRRGGNVRFVAEELQQVVSAYEYGWVGGKLVGSVVAQIGKVVEQHLDSIEGKESTEPAVEQPEAEGHIGDICSECGQPGIVYNEGCSECMYCGYSNCG